MARASGASAVVAQAMREAKPIAPALPLLDPVLLEELEGEGVAQATARVAIAKRQGGRARVVPNERTEALRTWLLGKHAHAADVFAQAMSRPVDKSAAELYCMRLEASEHQRRCAVGAAALRRGQGSGADRRRRPPRRRAGNLRVQRADGHGSAHRRP